MEKLHAFRSAITWSEPFIAGLVVFQCSMLLLSIYVSRRDRGLAPRITIMVIIAAIVKSSEFCNQYAAANWRSFCTQNYFDRGGMFMSIFVCTPLLFDSFIMLVFYLREASHLLVQVKTMQLNKQKRERNAAISNANTKTASKGANHKDKKHRQKKDL
jgi:transmembrane protein 18